MRCRCCAAAEDDQALRELLWLRHGCGIAALYGDDGEMQCNACLIDFKRTSAAAIRRGLEAIALRALSAPAPAQP
jgi:hypothetical protein